MSTAIAPHSPLQLPSPGERPEADVVIYDGQCQFCRKQVARLQRFDGRNRLAYLSLYDSEVSRRWPDLTHDALMAEMYVIDRTGQRHHGAGAIRYLSRRLPKLWWAAPLLHIPFSLPLWQAGYRWVAGMRYRWGKVEDCDDGSCQVHFGKK